MQPGHGSLRCAQEAHRRLLALGYRVSWRLTIDHYAYLCLVPPPGIIPADMGGPVGSSGEIILFVTPAADENANGTLPEGCR